MKTMKKCILLFLVISISVISFHTGVFATAQQPELTHNQNEYNATKSYASPSFSHNYDLPAM